MLARWSLLFPDLSEVRRWPQRCTARSTSKAGSTALLSEFCGGSRMLGDSWAYNEFVGPGTAACRDRTAAAGENSGV